MKSFDERYDEKVDRSGGPDACWPWTGATSQGYGQIYIEGRRREYAHRIALQRKLGRPIKSGFCSLHKCDNPPCNNPTHLFEGTKIDNNLDRAAKDRTVRGEAQHSAKLIETQIKEIRRRAAAGETNTALGAEFSVSNVAVSKIALRKTWRHVT